jgi:hypothetical protein
MKVRTALGARKPPMIGSVGFLYIPACSQCGIFYSMLAQN